MPTETRQRKRKSPPALTADPSSTTAPTMSTSTPNSQPDIFATPTSRATDTHVFFWSGVLSNWHQGAKFQGSRIFDLLLPSLEKLDSNITHPPMETFVSRLLSDHNFSCGEQWMMAMKAWFFETELDLGKWTPSVRPSPTFVEDEKRYQKLRAAMYEAKVPASYPVGSEGRQMWGSAVCKILRATTPKQQKALGRGVKGFEEPVWNLVSMPCVTAACVVRAQADDELRGMYLASGKREFVEGSPVDAIWGVGIHWKQSAIENPDLWCGENRLGKCHDEAARMIREMSDKGGLGQKVKK